MRTREEVQEIERHKYFLSEKRGHDVGWEVAERDWEEHHSAEWRRSRAATPSPVGATRANEAARGANGGTRSPNPERTEAADREREQIDGRGSRLRRWVKGLFS